VKRDGVADGRPLNADRSSDLVTAVELGRDHRPPATRRRVRLDRPAVRDGPRPFLIGTDEAERVLVDEQFLVDVLLCHNIPMYAVTGDKRTAPGTDYKRLYSLERPTVRNENIVATETIYTLIAMRPCD